MFKVLFNFCSNNPNLSISLLTFKTNVIGDQLCEKMSDFQHIQSYTPTVVVALGVQLIENQESHRILWIGQN